MARKDVDLVIRARDEAAKVVDSITSAINDFVVAQGDLNKSAGKTNSTLGALGTALSGLDKELRGLAVGDKIGQEFDRAQKAAQRLNAEFDETRAASRELARDLQRAEYATERLTTKANGAAQAQRKQSAALDRARKAQTDLTAALSKATTERDKLVRQDERLVASLTKQEARVAEVTSRYDRLAQEVASAANPTKTLQTRLESVTNSLSKQTTRLDELRSRYAATQQGIAQTGQRMGELSGRLESANAAVARQESVVNKINQNYRELEAAAKSASRNQNEIANAADKTADALSRQSQRIERAETELRQLGAAAGQADAALSRLAGQSGQALQRSFEQQRRAMLEAKREWTETTQAATRLAGEIARVGVPTREMAEAFIRNRAEAARAKQEYIAQRDSLHQLSGVLRQTGNDLESLRSRQQQFAQVTAQTGAAIAGIRQRAAQASTSYSLLSGNAQRAAQTIRQVGAAAGSTAGNTNRAATATNSLSDAYRRLYGESRQAMSWTQRLRGEVLSLVAAYGGIYGVIGLLNRVVQSYQTLEAATSRLNVAFEGDQQQLGQELDFIRRNANRLGIEFGALATEYSKFSIATQGTALEGQKTRDIFISVAEAARVNKSSFDELRGVFVALTQIVSKGAVQMEELRQQLGDRLPGALQLMADGLGVSTGELIKMMEAGEVTSEALAPFAEELDKRFGPGLAAALQTTTTALGRFQNAAFQALVQFGEAGFIQSFTDLLNNLSETLQSADFQSFAARVSQVFGLLIDVLGLAIDNFDLLVIAAAAFAGIKLGPLIISLVTHFAGLTKGLTRVRSGLASTRAGMVAAGATATTTAGAFRGLTLAVRGLVSSTGIGLAITAISVAIGWWATRADEATEALSNHQSIVDDVRDAYDAAGGATEDFFDSLDELSASQAEQNLRDIRQSLEDTRQEAERFIGGWTEISARRSAFNIFSGFGAAQSQYREIESLNSAFAAGEIEAKAYKDALDAIAEEAQTEELRAWAVELQGIADRAAELEDKTAEAEEIVGIMSGTSDEAAAAADRLSGALEDNGTAAEDAADSAGVYVEALEDAKKLIPELAAELEHLGRIDALEKALGALTDPNMGLAPDQMQEHIETVRQLRAALASERAGLEYTTSGGGAGTGGGILDEAMQHLGAREGSKALADYILSNDPSGVIDPQLATAWCAAFVNAVLEKQGIQSTGRANALSYLEFGQQTTNPQPGDIAVFARGKPGSGQGHVGFVVSVNDDGTVEILGGNQSGPGGGGSNQVSVQTRNAADVLSFRRPPTAADAATENYQTSERLAEEEQKRADARRDFHEQQNASIAQSQFELSLQDQEIVKREQALAIREAELEAEEAGTQLTQAQREAILQNVEAKYRQQEIDERNKATREAAAEAEERVNQLLTQRQALEEQLAIYKEEGDAGQVESTEAELQRVNAELQSAITNAQEMWAAVGGGAADSAIAKLQTASLEADRFGNEAKESLLDWNRVGQLFASGLTNAFDQFAQAVANGENVGEAARDAFLQFAADFLRQIAQMIIQQAILNALQGFMGGGFGGVGAGHTGGLVGSSRVGSGNATRQVNPAVFAGAMRYHTGGVVGLRPGEVPIIAKQGEEMLTQDDPRHILNGGGMAGQQQAPAGGNTKIVNAIDSASFLDAALSTTVGEKVIMNYIKANASAVKAALGQ